MHLFFENVAPHMFKLWSGRFFKDDTLNNSIPFVLSKSSWKEIGIEMENNKKNMPLDFGRPPRNIWKNNAGFKAEEWANWITLYSVPLLKSKLPERYRIYKYLLNILMILNLISKKNIYIKIIDISKVGMNLSQPFIYACKSILKNKILI